VLVRRECREVGVLQEGKVWIQGGRDELEPSYQLSFALQSVLMRLTFCIAVKSDSVHDASSSSSCLPRFDPVELTDSRSSNCISLYCCVIISGVVTYY
jgi:hypothetical protein